MKKILFFVLVSAVFLSASGCGNNSPEINQIYSQINFVNVPGEDNVTAELTVLFNADDEDGDDDIENLYIINDNSEFFWSADSSTWDRVDYRGLTWRGSRRMVDVSGGLPEPGEYRVLVTDKAGERVEDTVFIHIMKELPRPGDFPEIIYSDDALEIEIKSPENRNIISFYDSGGKLIAAYSVTPGIVRVKTLRDGSSIYDNCQTAKIAYYSNTLGAGVISGPYRRPSTD